MHVYHVKQWPDPVTPESCHSDDDGSSGNNRMVEYDLGCQTTPTV
jgi:hypothetical protein